MKIVQSSLLGLLMAISIPVQSFAAQPLKTLLMLDFEIIDDSQGGGTTNEHEARLRMISDHLRKAVAKQQLYQVLDQSAVQGEINELRHRLMLHDCNGCDIDVARKVNADRVMTGWVQKVSNLILNINIEIKDVTTGKTVLVKSVDIRGNTDETWLRGIRYMVRSMVEKKQVNR